MAGDADSILKEDVLNGEYVDAADGGDRSHQSCNQRGLWNM